jgi:addiction module HigA family antidote
MREMTRRPSHPGEILRGLYMDPLGLTVTVLAEHLGVSRKTLSKVLNGRGSVTPDMALRLARVFHSDPEVWLNLQKKVDLWDAAHASTGWRDVLPLPDFLLAAAQA